MPRWKNHVFLFWACFRWVLLYSHITVPELAYIYFYILGQTNFSLPSLPFTCDIMQFLSSLFTSGRVSKRTQAFAERFKYGIISSSLLSPGFASTPDPHQHRRSFSPTLPGKLASNHSRSTSVAESSATDQISLIIPTEPETHVWPLTLSITLAAAALSARFYALFVLLLISTLYYMHVHRWDIHSKPDIITPVSLPIASDMATYLPFLFTVTGSLTKFNHSGQGVERRCSRCPRYPRK